MKRVAAMLCLIIACSGCYLLTPDYEHPLKPTPPPDILRAPTTNTVPLEVVR